MNDVLQHLLAVADLDVSMAQLHRRRQGLPESTGLRDVELELAALQAQRTEAAARREELGAVQRDLEAQIATFTERRTAIERRMYAATGTAARDLQAMSEEVSHLTERRAELEELELVSLLDQDPVDAELTRLGEAMAPLQARAEELRRDVADEQRRIDDELAREVSSRAAASAMLPTALSDRYEALRARLRGAGAARLVGSRCDGCHLELSSVEVEKIRALPPGEAATCEQCGRILVPV